ncbi:MAG: hypothetical protein F6K17_28795 [Okeania sp. SIO3C4]|nr:hypothetical protein [Okeania sp. SIO3C4]
MKSIAAIALLAAAGSAFANFQVTEIYAGISGPDGTNDWFEVTNTGINAFDTGTLFWDDDNPNAGQGGQLDSFILQAGESAVFIINEEFDATLVTEFEALWGSIDNLGFTNGGGNLSQNGDSINISIDGGTTFTTTVAFDGSFANSGATIDTLNAFADSVIGVNGAYESNPFFNDNDLGGADETATLIGSPGAIPAPGAAVLAATAGLAAARRRRA